MSPHENEWLVGLQPHSLIGRKDELAAVEERLLKDDVRMVTLTGIAGVGKTRLAVAVADKVREAFTQVILVDLYPQTKAERVIPTIARAFGVLEISPGPLPERLAQAIGSRRILLILDNCEHLLEAMTEISTLLSACPGLKILATSREVLRLKWEWVFPVPPLRLPQLDPLPNLKALARVPSVNLFLQRAQARNTEFRLTKENARTVAELCIWLDGLPLAIELAAAQVGLLGPKALLTHLRKRLDISADSIRDLPVRHQTLRTAIDWSYGLLSLKEQCLYRRLSVFSGGWTLPAAEEVCAGDGLEENEILPLLGGLVDHSMVMVGEPTGEDKRYRFLETIHEYAREKMRESGEEEHLQRRHRQWFLTWAEQGEPNLWGPAMPEWLSQINSEFGNLRTALEWSRDTSGEAEEGIRLLAAISRFLEIRGHFIRGQIMVTDLLTLATAPTIGRARVLMVASVLVRNQGDLKQSRIFAEECLTISRKLDDVLDNSAILMILGTLSQIEGDPQKATALFDEAINLARSRAEQEPRALYLALFWMGQIHCLLGDNQRAIPILEEALEAVRRQGDPSFQTIILTMLGRALLGQGKIEKAKTLLLEGLRISRTLEYSEVTAYGLDYLGQVAWMQKESQKAVRLLGAAAALRSRIGVITWLADPNYDKIVTDLGKEAILAAQETARDLPVDKLIEWALRPEVRPADGDLTDLAGIPSLSSREWEVAELIARGLSNPYIARELVVSKRTIGAHVSHILNKLGLSSRAQIAAWFIANRPADPEQVAIQEE